MADTETFPRWNLPDVDFLETDASAIQSGIITGYETAAGRSLAPGDPVRLFLLTVADVIIQLRDKANIAAQQNILSYARGQYLDAYGVNMATPRLPEAYAITTFRFTLLQWIRAGGKVMPGLQRRRKAECRLCLTDPETKAGETLPWLNLV